MALVPEPALPVGAVVKQADNKTPTAAKARQRTDASTRTYDMNFPPVCLQIKSIFMITTQV